MINNRQNGNGRRRGRTGNAPRPSGGQPDRGSRLDNRARGNASQLHEKYKTLAADAQRQGDRVMTEYYLQFADHYFRVLSETRARFEDQQPRRDRFDAQSDEFDDGEGGDEGYEERAPERAPRGQEWDRGDGDGRQDRNRQDRGEHNDRPERNDQRADRPERNDRNDQRIDRGDRPDRNDGQQRGVEGQRIDTRDRQDRGDERAPRVNREARPPRDGFEPRQRLRRNERQDGERQPAAQFAEPVPQQIEASLPPVEPASPPVEAVAVTPAPVVAVELPLDMAVPERRPRGRPRKVVAPVEPAADARIELDRLPPALSDTTGDGTAGEPKPRRTRRPRSETTTA